MSCLSFVVQTVIGGYTDVAVIARLTQMDQVDKDARVSFERLNRMRYFKRNLKR